MFREVKKIEKDWEFNVLGVVDHRSAGALRFYFDFVKLNHEKMDGDIVEAGVFKGSSLLGMAVMLKELGSKKKVFGFDSFSGFPPIFSPNDKLDFFDQMLTKGQISASHHLDVQRNREWRSILTGLRPEPHSISSSADFSATSKALVEKKIRLLGLDNVVLVDGPFEETMKTGTGPDQIMAGLVDCDLYNSHVTSLSYLWPKLVYGGLLYLDEYYSLKFPGARVAADDFRRDRDDVELKQFLSQPEEFERWGFFKRSDV